MGEGSDHTVFAAMLPAHGRAPVMVRGVALMVKIGVANGDMSAARRRVWLGGEFRPVVRS